MLQTLRVKNLAVVENIQVDFNEGLNTITGETGAGKSILVGALNLVLGERADKELIRAGAEKCGVEATFLLNDDGAVNSLLDDVGIDPCENGRLIIRRIISTSGPGKNLLNDCPATLQVLRRIGNLLVDMHGPHDHQSLLSQEFQLDLLDSFGHLWTDRASYEKVYRQLVGLQGRRRELEGDDEEVARQIDMRSFQVKEIEDADLTDADEQDLEREHTVVANAHRILELSARVREALTEGETAAFSGLAFAQTALGDMAEVLEEARAWRKEAESISIELQELSNSINQSVQNIEGDPARLEWLEDRMALIHKLKRKYGASIPEITAFLETAKQQLHDLETRGQQIAELDAEIAQARRKVESLGRRLGKARRKAADSLATAVTDELRSLGFEHGAFDVGLQDSEPLPSGMDTIEFGFAPNVGEPMRALRAIASSGEISRVMLATKTVLAAHDRIPVMIFDEIDANVGGEMGHAVGEKLASVSRSHQVVCITHLPQVAVHGTTHFVVVKEVRQGRTRTLIRLVEGRERVEEVARMLGGKELTSVTLKHAREMLGNLQ